MAWQTVSPAAQSWTTQESTAQSWTVQTPPVSPLRLARVFTQELPQEDLPVIYQIRSDTPFLVATGSGIQIRSSITEAL